MSPANGEFLELLRATFKVEAAEHLQVIAAGLLALEKAPAADDRRSVVEAVFRAAHSLKGAARAVDFTEIESLCGALEDTFAAWKRHQQTPALAVLDSLHRSLDAITAAIAAPLPASVTSSASARPLFALPDWPQKAPLAAPMQLVVPEVTSGPGGGVAEDTVRITVAKLDARLVEAEEMLNVKLATLQRTQDLRVLGQRFKAWKDGYTALESQTRALRQALDQPSKDFGVERSGLAGLLAFLDWNLDHLKAAESSVAALVRVAHQDLHVVGRLVDDLLENSKKLLLLPFGTLAAQFPKMVRDLCRDLGKEADLRILGEDVEIDKRILEEMKDPLLHLLRNSIDHGIEPSEQRRRLGKPSRATITLVASRVTDHKVLLLLSDDGAGIDTNKVKAAAVRNGLISTEDAARLDESEARALIFQSQLSTSPIITPLSGRGLGLAIVREKARRLGGDVGVESIAGQGTSFRVILPTTRATFRGILIEAGKRKLLVPTMQVERVARVMPDAIRTVEGREAIVLDARPVSLVRLADALELAPEAGSDPAAAGATVIVLGYGDERVAFVVDAVHGEQEVLVKPLPRPLSRVRNVAGAAVLGSGDVALIVHVTDLLKSARGLSGASVPVAAASKTAKARAVLVAEDSITSRMLIKNILESAGYRVKTAVDGVDAYSLLQAEEFDLLVSDVEMPRLSGFDLTTRIRANRKLAELPVILVTALETRQDRERGIDVGANAYIVKSSFEQSNLLEAVQRLI